MDQRLTGRVPGWHLLALAVGLGAVLFCAGPVSDVDVFWHVEVGAFTLHGQAFPHPDPWAYSRPGVHWHSTAWLTELALAAIQRSAGWAGIVVARAVLAALIVAVLYRLLVRRSTWQGPLVFAIVVLPLTRYVQERPQTVSLLFVMWLARLSYCFLTTRTLPRRLWFVAMTYLWALVHGLFVLAPAVLAVLALGAGLARGRQARAEVRSLLSTAALATAISALTPMGPRLLLAPVTVGQAARGVVGEWFPTNLTTPACWGFAAVLAIVAAGWARSARPVPKDELLFVLAVAAFGFLAMRNAGVASILLAPLAVDWLETRLPARSQLTVGRRPFVVVASLGSAAVLAAYTHWPVLPSDRPAAIAEVLAAQPGKLRVFDDYNISGYLISRAGGHVSLVVDGRADRYGHAFLERERNAVLGGAGWQSFVHEVRPQVAVLGKDDPLAQLLVSVEGWRPVMDDHAYRLLRAPDVVFQPR
jgi:hypothetical protein